MTPEEAEDFYDSRHRFSMEITDIIPLSYEQAYELLAENERQNHEFRKRAFERLKEYQRLKERRGDNL